MAITLLALMLMAVAPVGGRVSPRLNVARSIATELAAGDFAAASVRFSPDFLVTMPPERLAAFWRMSVQSLGGFKRLGETREEGEFVLIHFDYELGSLGLKIGLDPKLKVVSLRASDGKPAADFENAARGLLEELASGAWETALERFYPGVAREVSAAALASTWLGLVSRVGTFVRVLEVRFELMPAHFVTVEVSCVFAKANVIVDVVLDSSLRVSRRLVFRPVAAR